MKKRSLPQNLSANKDGTHLDIFLIGLIGDWWEGNTAAEFISLLNSFKNLETITVFINTLGGSIYEGLPMLNFLKHHSAQITTINIGYAYSMGGIIQGAADEGRAFAYPSSITMAHKPYTGIYGNADDLRKEAETLDIHENTLTAGYEKRLGISQDAVKTLFREEKYWDAESALKDGVIDKIIDSNEDIVNAHQVSNEAVNYANQHYQNMPEDLMQRMNKAALNKSGFSKFLSSIVGEKPPKINQEGNQDMTPEEVSAMLDKRDKDNEKRLNKTVGSAVASAFKAEKESELEAQKQADRDKEISNLKADNAAKDAEILALKKADGVTEIDENSGAMDETDSQEEDRY